jgi:hypothetical protein
LNLKKLSHFRTGTKQFFIRVFLLHQLPKPFFGWINVSVTSEQRSQVHDE